MERRRRGRGGTFPPEGPGEPSDCWERGGGLLGAAGSGRNLGGYGDPVKIGAFDTPPPSPTLTCCHQLPLP